MPSSPLDFSCLGSRRLPASPSTCASSADEDEYYAAHCELPAEEKSVCCRQQHRLARAHSCSHLQVPSLKSLLHRPSSHECLLPAHHSHQDCMHLIDSPATESSSACAAVKQRGKRAPKGHVTVYVDAETERHVVPIAYLSHPHFLALLERAEREYGLQQKGPGLRIPCSRSELRSTLHLIQSH